MCERVRERESGNPDECGSCKTLELMLKRKMVSTSKCFALTRKNRAYHAFAIAFAIAFAFAFAFAFAMSAFAFAFV